MGIKRAAQHFRISSCVIHLSSEHTIVSLSLQMWLFSTSEKQIQGEITGGQMISLM